MKKFALLLMAVVISCAGAYAQGKVKILLKDSESGDPVEYATVALYKGNAKSAAYAALTSTDGDATMFNVKSGTYTLKVELMGYKSYVQNITVEGNLDLGTVKMKQDRQMLDAASVSAVGNPIIIKKDTVEYNANAFKTTENDVLEDLLKKLPGVEVGEDGSITVNGETINKITIDGKTFFLDDPQLASKNIPAKVVEKLKVIEKKSDQAQFTGIDDGQEEYVIDLSVKKGMMKGLFGNVMGGAGHDIPASKGADGFEVPNDWRYQTAGFVGHFTESQQLSGLVNFNNANNRGFNDLSGSMMQGMRGGGGGMGRGQGGWGQGNGITTSYMAGVNGAWDLLDKKMELGGNYLFNGSDKDVKEQSRKTTYLPDGDMIYDGNGTSWTRSLGHRFGLRLDHKFSDNTSILFQPQIDFGTGRFSENNNYSTVKNGEKLNDGTSSNSGDNRNLSTRGFLLFRQRLGKPGRTLSVMLRYSFSNNDLNGRNGSVTSEYGTVTDEKKVDQTVDQNRKSTSLSGRITYTEPLGKNFFLEANYQYAWNLSTSYKNTFDNIAGKRDDIYSNTVYNKAINQTAGINAMYQTDKVRAQLGFSVKPTTTHNETSSRANFDRKTLNYSPQAMLWWEISENSTLRFFYYGNSNQPSVNQLMPVPDNTDPLNVQYGNIRLDPYFSHNLRGNYRYNNKKTFSSINIHFGGGLVQSPIVSSMWYSPAGVQYTMPFNGPTSANANINGFFNIPIAKSNFTISNMLRMNWSKSASYVLRNGKSMQEYYDPDWTTFNDGKFLEDVDSKGIGEFFETNNLQTLGFTERLRLIYRNDALELTASGRTRFNKSWYSIASNKDQTATWNNQVRLGVNWTWELTGIGIKSEFNFNWFNGYSTPQPNQYVWDAEISKLLLKKKMTIAVKCYDILGQSKNLTVTDSNNYRQEALNNTLGRYIMCSITYRFGNMDKSRMNGRGGFGGARMR